MRMVPRRKSLSPTLWAFLGLVTLGLLATSCHREACPGQITQADQPATEVPS